MEDIKDLIIIGAAAAGCSAAVYAARRNLNTLIIAKDIGGEVALSGEVENWIGIQHISGFELAQNFYKHVQSYNVPTEVGFEVTGIKKEGNLFEVTAGNFLGESKVHKAKTVLVASGIHPRHLNIPGEEELKGMGVTYCTVCDGPLFKGKVTTTIGAGNSALESALMLSELASKVYVITKYPESEKGGFPKGEDILIKKVKAKENIEVIYEATTNKIIGEGKVAQVAYTQNGEEKTIDTDGVMVHIGMVPNSYFVEIAEKNSAGEIKVNTKCETSVPGLFAAGDVTDVPFKQISISAGQGATGALSAIEYLNHFED